MPYDQLQAQLADAEERREEACEEAHRAADDRDGYRLELARVRGLMRGLEAALRTERHEHAETRRQLDAARRCPASDADRPVGLARRLGLLLTLRSAGGSR